MVFALVDALPGEPGAIAYHDVNGVAVPVAFLALSTCDTLDDVSTAISHEMCETQGDVACNIWCDDESGAEWARELCDAVESNSYGVDLGDGQPPIMVSDFLLPAFFEPNATGPMSFLAAGGASPATVQGTPSMPFQTATGGYQIKRDSGGNETQVTAVTSEGSRRGMLAKAGKHHWSSRAARRGLKRAA